MSNKKVRRVRSATPPVATETQSPLSTAASTPPRSTAAPATAVNRRASVRRNTVVRQTMTVEELRQEYTYVIHDLRWIFFLALAMFALLIALNLVLS